MNIMTVQSSSWRGCQRGAVLMIGMVMMLMVTLIAVGLIRLSMRHTQVVNNEQVRTEAVTAAHYALDQVMNQSYDAGNWTQYSGVGTNVNVNLGISQTADAADGTGAIAVKVSKLANKRCRQLQNRELFESDGTITAANRTCIRANTNSGLTIGTSNGGDPSVCSDILWEMQAEVDTASAPQMLNASTPVVQGVEMLVGGDCP
jgi:hypothetical protein